jgi:hypothetical protein
VAQDHARLGNVRVALIAFVQNSVRFASARFETILGHLVVSLRGVKATKQSPKLLLRGLPRADALEMTTFSAIAFVQNFEFIVKPTSILALAIKILLADSSKM